MKITRKIWSLFLAVFVSLTISCETEKLIFEGPYFVRFTEDALSRKESFNKTIRIEVHNAGPVPKSDVTINYIIGGSARENIDYKFISKRGEVTIKSGERFGYIDIQLINNSNNILESQDVTFTLMSIENNNGLQVGQGKSQIGRLFTLTIQDDCILGDTYYGIVTPSDVPVENISIIGLDEDCSTYLLSNWDIYVFRFPAERSLTFEDNGDNTITIPRQEDLTLNPEQATIEGFGVVDPTTRIITITVRLLDFEDQPEVTFQLIPD